ncbi:hypothetical protein I4F81_003053 [Pyropia yezoensis]|uniref:Uncharacterized protein n=1 Tax=Pyropia yezoensis TaxID=2788 RepID=A0ACC3BR32_PYRYE|nr:hypothetical protein I4F81_003053 [Neopyropia yezoensis]
MAYLAPLPARGATVRGWCHLGCSPHPPTSSPHPATSSPPRGLLQTQGVCAPAYAAREWPLVGGPLFGGFCGRDGGRALPPSSSVVSAPGWGLLRKGSGV